MKHYIKTVVAASAMLAMIGCSKDWPFERNENGKVEIEGGGGQEPEGAEIMVNDPDNIPVYPRDVHGTVSVSVYPI